MRVTRSSSRAQATSNNISHTTQGKRKVEDETPNPPNKKRTTTTSRQDNDILQPEISKILPMTVPVDNGGQAEPTIVPATLTFSFEEGKKHLISVDHRFYDLFSKMPCKPFEHLEAVHPFRALATSIIGQQISWLAARSVKHKFVRLFDPSIPEKIEDYEEHSRPSAFFPSPTVVAKTDVATLRTAGLSQRKAEYVLDLAQQFADGRLSTDKLIDANDEDLAKMLIAVRGIGKWTVDMFAIFSLRRPDILPIGDLGVQRGLAVWFLSLHSPNHNWGWTPKKLPTSSSTKTKKTVKPTRNTDTPTLEANDAPSSSVVTGNGRLPTPDASSVPPVGDEDTTDILPSLPAAFTPSIKNTLQKPGIDEGSTPIPLPEGVTVELLKTRLSGKNKVKGAFLTPKEMEDLTESWKPYRSLGVFYMWSIAGEP